MPHKIPRKIRVHDGFRALVTSLVWVSVTKLRMFVVNPIKV